VFIAARRLEFLIGDRKRTGGKGALGFALEAIERRQKFGFLRRDPRLDLSELVAI
jgi:hypothetical protein